MFDDFVYNLSSADFSLKETTTMDAELMLDTLVEERRSKNRLHVLPERFQTWRPG